MTPERNGIGMTSQRTRDRLVARLRAKGIGDRRVLEAIATTPRHLFVDEALSSRAYEDTALPIGQSQTISQPYIVACMTEQLLAAEREPEKVLEIGTGSGYQAAVLARLYARVFTLERIDKLLREARRRFHRLGLNNIYTRHADGYDGWSAQAPFDAIMVTAASSSVPQVLVDQLAEGARLLLPVGESGMQWLTRVEKRDGGIVEERLLPVSFVPMLGGLD